jgi:hypothetical protein
MTTEKKILPDVESSQHFCYSVNTSTRCNKKASSAVGNHVSLVYTSFAFYPWLHSEITFAGCLVRCIRIYSVARNLTTTLSLGIWLTLLIKSRFDGDNNNWKNRETAIFFTSPRIGMRHAAVIPFRKDAKSLKWWWQAESSCPVQHLVLMDMLFSCPHTLTFQFHVAGLWETGDIWGPQICALLNMFYRAGLVHDISTTWHKERRNLLVPNIISWRPTSPLGSQVIVCCMHAWLIVFQRREDNPSRTPRMQSLSHYRDSQTVACFGDVKPAPHSSWFNRMHKYFSVILSSAFTWNISSDCQYILKMFLVLDVQSEVCCRAGTAGHYSPNLGLGLPPWNCPFHFGFLDLRHSVGLLARVISSSQGLCLYTNTEKRTHTKHPCPGWDSNPRSRLPSERRQCMP